MTPADVWPVPRITGRPGYSARGLNAVSPPADTPLSVAKRLAGQRIARQMQPRIDALSTEPEDISESLKAHQRLLKEQFDIELRACRLLDSYFGAVVTELADTPNQTPDIKRYLKWARRERASALKRGDL